MSDEFRLGPWVVKPSQNTISNNGNTTRLEPKMVEVLVCLAESPGKTVSKEQLIRRVWGDTFVTDDVLTRCISELRKALEDDSKAPRVIETIPRKGYRLLEKVEAVQRIKPAPPPERKWKWKWWASGAACLGLVATVAALSVYLRMPSKPTAVTRFVLQPPPGRAFDMRLRLSPDGRKLALFTSDAAGKALWLRRFDSPSVEQLPGTEGAEDGVAWSPDSRYLLFVVGGKIKKTDIAGGLPRPLCDIPGMSVESLGPNNTVVLSRSLLADDRLSPMKLLNLSDCSSKPLLPRDAVHYDWGQKWVSFLPDGRHFLFAGLRIDRQHDVRLGTLGSPASELLVRDASDPRYVEPGYLFFHRRGFLFAQPFKLDKLRLEGDPIQVVPQQLDFGGLGGIASYDVSSTGTLVYQEQADIKHKLYLADASGTQTEMLDPASVFTGPRMLAGGRKLLTNKVDIKDHTSDLWVYDLEHRNWERVSFEASKGEHRGLWSRDGTNIVYSAAVNATMDLYRTSTLPPHQAEILLANDHDNYPTDFTPDGQLLLYTQFANEKADFWLLPMNGAGKPFRLMETPFDEQEGRFSADGRWIVYSSDESGSREIYVRSFSGPSHQYRISWGGGRLPRWGPEGSSIYYLTSDERLMEVAVRLRASEFKAGKPRFVFSLPGEESEYEVLPGRQFLILQQLVTRNSPPTVVLNWTSSLGLER